MNHHPALVMSVALALTLAAAPSSAQIARVFVSVNGNDGNACASLATRCRTLNGAIAQVYAEGEVIVVDSGSYAGAAITKSVRVNVAPGVVAFSGLPITVNPGNAGSVVLRGLTMKAVIPAPCFPGTRRALSSTTRTPPRISNTARSQSTARACRSATPRWRGFQVRWSPATGPRS